MTNLTWTLLWRIESDVFSVLLTFALQGVVVRVHSKHAVHYWKLHV